VAEQGFIKDYSGIRISKTGRRFRIIRVTVWKLITKQREPNGRGAMFSGRQHL